MVDRTNIIRNVSNFNRTIVSRISWLSCVVFEQCINRIVLVSKPSQSKVESVVIDGKNISEFDKDFT